MVPIKYIKDLATNATTYNRGSTYSNNGCISNFKVSVGENVRTLSAKVIGNSSYITCARLDSNTEKILEYSCSCPAFLSYPGICKHIVGMLLKYNEIPEYRFNVINFVDNKKKALVNNEKKLISIEKSIIDNILEEYEEKEFMNIGENKKVCIQPILCIDNEQNISIQCKIGDRRLYVVKDIVELGKAIQDKSEVAYGKELAFVHKMDNFDLQSRKIAEFICIQVAEYLNFKKYVGEYNAYSSRKNTKNLSLSVRGFNEFFDIYKNKTIMCDFGENQNYINKITLSSEQPPIDFNLIEHDDKFFKLKPSIKISNIKIIDNKIDKYFIWDEVMYKIDDEFALNIFPLVKNIIKSKKENILISKKQMPKFCSIVMPKIKNNIQVSLKDSKLEDYMPPELEIKIYLDMPNENVITAKCNYIYGEKVINPFNKFEKKDTDIVRNKNKEISVENIISNYKFVKDSYETLAKKYNKSNVSASKLIIKNKQLDENKGVYSNDEIIYLNDEDDIYTFISDGIDELMLLGDVYISDNLKESKIRKINQASIGIKLNNDFLDINLDELGLDRKELIQVLKSYRIKKKFHRLKSGEFISLENSTIGDLVNVIDALDIDDKKLAQKQIKLPKYRALYLENVINKNKNMKVKKDENFKQLVKDFNQIDYYDVEVPENLKDTLRNYQEIGYGWLKMLSYYGFGGILADDMGLGKTLQVITLLSSQLNSGKSILPSLIISPTSLVLNWVNEFKKFAKEIKITTITGTIDEREEKISHISEYSIVITSYELLKRDISKYENIDFENCIIDEAQYIKNNLTKNAKSVKEIKSKARIALTGTPIENSLGELWSIFDFIMPGYLFSYNKFRKNLESAIVKDDDKNASERLKKMIAPFILRRLKKDVLKELPNKIESVVYSKLNEAQYKIYMAYIAKVKEEVIEKIDEDNFDKSRMKILSCLTRLRQICCHPSLFIENYTEGSAKLETCLEIVQNAISAGHKILLFSQFTSMLDKIGEEFKKLNISYSLLKGDVKAKNRMSMVDEFNNGNTSVFLISLRAGGLGLNLTSADIVIHYDPWWNLSVQNQATDRAYRMGQTNNVQVFKLISENTIEEKIKEMQDKKDDLTQNILSTEHTLINQLSKKQLLELFEL